MPVHLEHISQPTEQDWIDLGKIYADAPQEWLSDASDINTSLQSLLDQQVWFIGGRFNSRLLGAMQASKKGNNVILQHLCVRNITTNRGVAHQIMHHLNAQYFHLYAFAFHCQERRTDGRSCDEYCRTDHLFRDGCNA